VMIGTSSSPRGAAGDCSAGCLSCDEAC
jgi:hypothetical protein